MPKDYSPFTPGVPARPEDFAGKAAEVEQMLGSCRAAQAGRLERTFVIGDRGIGKSSLCNYVRHAADAKLDMLGLHVYLGGARSLEEMCRRIFEQLAKSSLGRPWYDRVVSLLGKHVKQVGLFGVNIQFAAGAEELRGLATSLPEQIEGVLSHLKDDRRGMLLILDDINGLAESDEFADWLKTFIDSVATHHAKLPLHLVLAGLPERRASLLRLQPSLNRAFAVLLSGKISVEDSTQFFADRFKQAGTECAKGVLALLSNYAGGYPALLQEIGDAVFKHDLDGAITMDDAAKGLVAAAKVIGEKYLDSVVLGAISSEQYRGLLHKLASRLEKDSFVRKELGSELTENEMMVFDNFARKMRGLGVLEAPAPGVYRFTNDLHRLYFALSAGPLKGVPRQR